MVDVAVPPVPAASALGKSIPADIPHAVSVSLPRWQDNIDYEEGRLGDVLETGYPRFFIHRSIQKVSCCCPVTSGRNERAAGLTQLESDLLPAGRTCERQVRATARDMPAASDRASGGPLPGVHAGSPRATAIIEQWSAGGAHHAILPRRAKLQREWQLGFLHPLPLYWA